MIAWLTDRAGWQEWERVSAWSSHVHRLTPDAVGTVRLDWSEVVAFVEVDLASMAQTVLKQKVARYLAYAADRAWEGRHPHCLPMLLLTTTPTRAASFVHAASQVIARHVQSAEIRDRAAALVKAACGLVRDPARADRSPREHVGDGETSVDDGQAGLVREQPPYGDLRFAGGGLRPVAGNGGVEVEAALLDQHVAHPATVLLVAE